ncbi:MAG: RluA family pseudouridine synthase [Phycisphaeraceae bacterium]|nr:RluA family pseudouridine synthase [Phycisphaeraceae bacterium]
MTSPPRHPSPNPTGPLLCVVFAAPDFAVIDKPAGLRSVPARGWQFEPERFDSVETRARQVFDRPTGPVMVHRLDAETSGLLVIGLTRAAHAKLSRQFIHRKVGKSYVALVDGRVEGESGEVDLPLCLDWENRPRQRVDRERGKPSRTLWRVLDRREDPEGPITRVQFRPETGRTHQLRVHASVPRGSDGQSGGLGAPIRGDPLYGNRGSLDRMYLHAESLAFWHPRRGAWLKFESPAPF